MTYYFITAIRTSLDSSNTPSDCLNDWQDAMNNGGTLFSDHTQAWRDLWTPRIELSGDPYLAQVVNASFYYILSSVRADWPYALSPGGLASNGYNGHVFWDCETWMYPSILLTRPDLANGGLLKYRLNHQAGAAMKAQSYNKGYQGLMFPWESAFTGQEVCPVSALTGQLEQHISGDISYAFKQYWDITHNSTWLSEVYPLIYGIAQFWASRVTSNQFGNYEILGVIPPDEYAVNVNNSVYTNAVAAMSLQFAVNAGILLNQTTPASWSNISKNMKIPLDSVNQFHLEYDTYTGQLIKQADVILLGYPLQYPMPDQLRFNDLSYYQARTDYLNGPAMTFAMETIAWLELGDSEWAAEKWAQSYANAQPPFLVWTETPTGGTVNFITGAGGFLQGVLFGYGGIRIKDNSLYFNPQLPPNVHQVIFSEVNYLGNRIRVTYTDVYLEVVNLSDGGTPLTVQPFQEDSAPLNPFEPFTSYRVPFTIFPTNSKRK
jgi:trehalose/maltose hydrolase-like predicted phosphorylase